MNMMDKLNQVINNYKMDDNFDSTHYEESFKMFSTFISKMKIDMSKYWNIDYSGYILIEYKNVVITFYPTCVEYVDKNGVEIKTKTAEAMVNILCRL